jgi:uncharacterized protein YajQ (UPF0234 family)
MQQHAYPSALRSGDNSRLGTHSSDSTMPSFDIVSEVDKHELTNAIDQAKRDLDNRYDLRGTDARFEHEENVVTQFAPSEFQLDQMLEILHKRLAGRHIDLRAIELGDVETNLAGARRKITIKQGIEQVQAKKIIARIKEAKLKVDTQIAGEKVRVIGKKRDDLQTAIALLRKADLELPLQFENFRD